MTSGSTHTTQRGFTLIEITIGIVLLGILFVTGARMLSDSLISAQISNRMHGNSEATRYAMERLSREIRGVSFNNSTQSFDITTATATHMVFVKSGATTSVNVDLQLAGQTLTLGYPQLTTNYILLDSVSAFTLSYLDQNMAATQDTSLIRFVNIDLSLNAADTPPTTLRTLVALRGE
jgi:prepilin-type N-terminal cleavage/methylation domain-containing protein